MDRLSRVPEDIEREHIQRSIDIIHRLSGERPLSWYTGRTSPNTRWLVIEEGASYMTLTITAMTCHF